MPELPEVETIAKQLNQVLVGRVIEKVEVLREKSFGGNEDLLIGKKIESVGRRSKMMVIEFGDRDDVLLIHLKMTGQLVLVEGSKRTVGGHPTDDWVNELPSKHTRVIFDFKDGSRLFFNDMRVFGWIKMLRKNDLKKMWDRLPPDVVDDEFDTPFLKNVLSSSGRAVKLVILDQKKMGGIGNIYANDALYLAKIDPRRQANDLNDKEVKRLGKAIREVVNKGVELGGATYSSFVDSKGQGGRYQDHFLVYGKEGEKCSSCDEEIRKFKLMGRGTYWCLGCQR